MAGLPAGLQNFGFGPSRILTEAILARPPRISLARLIAPVLPVTQRAATILRVDKTAQALRARNTIRAMGATTHRVSFDINEGQSYNCLDHSQETALPLELAALEVSALSDMETWLALLWDLLTVSEDVEMFNKIVAATTGDLVYTPGTKWDAALGTPVADLNLKIGEGRVRSGGIELNCLMMTDADARACFLDGPEFEGKVKFTETPTLDALANMIRSLTGLEQVNLVKGSVVNNSATDTPDMQEIWADTALLYHAAPNIGSGRMTGNPFCTPVWTAGDAALKRAGAGGFMSGFTVDTYAEDQSKSTILRLSSYNDQMVTYPNGDTTMPALRITGFRTA